MNLEQMLLVLSLRALLLEAFEAAVAETTKSLTAGHLGDNRSRIAHLAAATTIRAFGARLESVLLQYEGASVPASTNGVD